MLLSDRIRKVSPATTLVTGSYVAKLGMAQQSMKAARTKLMAVLEEIGAALEEYLTPRASGHPVQVLHAFKVNEHQNGKITLEVVCKVAPNLRDDVLDWLYKNTGLSRWKVDRQSTSLVFTTLISVVA